MTPSSGVSLLALVLASASPCLVPRIVLANPTGGTVSAGSAAITSSGNTLTVNQSSNKAIIDWRGFDISAGETTQFQQPSSSSLTLNRVNSNSASVIDGNLTANGNIVIVNQNGVLFGKNAKVNVNSILVTTADIDDDKFMAGGALSFNKAGNPNASIVNEGMITAKQAGLVGLVAPNVLNSGIITAKLGTIALASGDTATLDLYGDDLLEVQASPALQSQLVSNSGKLVAKGGTIQLTAAAAAETVNSLIAVGGTLNANAVGTKNGHIYIYAEGSNAVPDNVTANKGVKTGSSTVLVTGTLTATSKHGTGGKVDVLGDAVGLSNTAIIDVSGETGGGDVNIGGAFHGAGTTPTATTTIVQSGAFIAANAIDSGNGGNVAVWSDGATIFNGTIMAEGGLHSGNGGFVETSGHGTLTANGYVDLTSPQGLLGTWLLDPTNITIYGGVTPAFTGASSGISSSDSSYVGNLSTSLQLWLDASNTTAVTLTYNSLSTTATGTSGTNTITVGSNTGLVVGERVQIGGSSGTQLASVNDTSNIYTITAINGTSVTLDANLASSASGATLYGGYVSQLSDLSGNGNNATQATAANMPLWISNGQNGLGVAYFNGSNNYLNGTITGITGNNDRSVISTASYSNTSTTHDIINIGADSSGQSFGLGTNGSSDTLFQWSNDITGGTAITAFQILTGIKSGNLLSLYKNGLTEVSPTSLSSANITSTNYRLGGPCCMNNF